MFLFGKPITVAVLAMTLAVNLHAQVEDTINKKTPLFVGKDALILGVFADGTAVIGPFDKEVASRLQNPRTQENLFLKNAATGFRLLGDPGQDLELVGEDRRVDAERLAAVAYEHAPRRVGARSDGDDVYMERDGAQIKVG